MEKLEVDSKSGSEEEFFDCLGNDSTLNVWLTKIGSSYAACLLFIHMR